MPHKLELQLQVVPVVTTIPESGLGKDQTSTAIRPEVISPAMQAINISHNLGLQQPIDIDFSGSDLSEGLRTE